MIYALNSYNIVEGKEDQYKRYTVEAGRVLQRVGASVVVTGHEPIRMLKGNKLRKHLIVVQFPDEDAFSLFLELVELNDLDLLREEATEDYLWTLYKDWNMQTWVNE